MADKYDKEAALLVCTVDFPVDKTRDRVAAALREAGAGIDALKAEVERLKKVIKEKYDESAFLESELVEKDVEIAALKAGMERLKKLLRYVAPSVDHFTCPSYPQCKRCEIERMLEAK